MSNVRVWVFIHREAIRRFTRALVGVLAVSCALAGALAVVRSRPPKCGGWFRPACQECPGLDAALKARAAGRYDQVAALTKSALDAHPAPTCWREFQAQFDRDLSVKFRLEYLPGRRGAPKPPAPGGHLRLSPDDRYYVIVNASAEAYLYLFQIDGAGNLTAIFPNAETTILKNPVSPGEQRIPGMDQFLSVSSRPGLERLFLIAANWEIPDLQQIAHEAEAAKEGSRKNLAALFRARAANEIQYAPLPGLKYRQWDIESLGTPRSGGAEKE